MFCFSLHRSQRELSLIVASALWLVAPRAHAQSRNLDVQLFLPTPTAGSTFTIDRPSVPRHLTFVVGVGANYALRPLVRTGQNEKVAVVKQLAQAELLAALGLFEVMELGVALPLSWGQSASDPAQDTPTYRSKLAPGDVRLAVKVPIVRGDFALSARGTVTLPTGDDGEFLGRGYWTAMPSVVASYRVGALTLASELGYRLRRRTTLGNLEQDDELQASLGGAFALRPELALIAEAQLRAGLGGKTVRGNELPAEADVGVRVMPGSGFSIDAGVGRGLLAGYGAPEFRGFVVVRFATERESCAAGPEDYDGFQDGDFCADLDNDADGFEDAIDECPNDAEDRDGFQDDDGCPDADNDADGVTDARDRCPSTSEDRDGFQDDDGCPELDNDEDGIADGADECPMEPEDRDAFEDDDGCPEPGPKRATVTVTDTRILISERIYFDFDRDTIRPVSKPLLDEVADVIRQLPKARRIRVEGYSDDQGVKQYNLDLSYRRARSVVEYLAARGVARDRLEYAGYGDKHPVAPNQTVEGRALNRRVEFTILEPMERGAGPEGEGRRRRRKPTEP